MKRLSALLALLMLVTLFVQAQPRQVTGTVTGSDDGMPLPGVSIQVKGTTTGGTTDMDGKFSLNVPSGSSTLVFRFVGFKEQEVVVNDRSIVNVILESESLKVDEVVVTAIGIKRSEKSLGYAATSVGSDNLSKAREASLMSSLQGKVAGVQISTGGGTPGASTKVILRGYASLTGNNNPLYVVDGSPIDNTSSSSNGVDFGNGASAVNPDDVESVTILKGASATALYGSRASSGVVMITTKSGKSSKTEKIKVTYSGNATYSSILRIPEMQNIYGQGWSGRFALEENGSWGPKMDGKVRAWGAIYNNSQQIKPFSAQEDNVKDFYETGTSYTHSVSLSGGNEKSNFYMSYSNTSEDGVVPDATDFFDRNTFSIRGTTKGDKMSLTASINYVKKQAGGPSDGNGGSNSAANLYSEILQIPRDMSIVDFKDYKNNPFNTENYYFTVYAANPYYAFHENSNKFNEDRMFGNATITYQFLPELKGTVRLGTDVTNSQDKSWEGIVKFRPDSWALNNPGSAKKDNPGYYSEGFAFRRELNIDYLLSYDKKVNDAINLNGLVGFNVNQRNGKSIASEITALDIPGFYNISNSPNPATTSTYEYKRRLYGVFGQIDFSFKDFWFITAMARNDYSSTLPTNNNSFFYPGVNTSLLISEAFPEVKSFMPYAKVRASWGRTGKDAGSYQILSIFSASQIANPFGNLNFPLVNTNGSNVAAFELGNQIGNPELQPEISTEYELGVDLRFFENRFGIDFAYYNKQTTDQILAVPLATSSGYSSQIMNFGKMENKGIELMITLVPIKTKDFDWTMNVNYTRNRGKVLELASGLDEVRLTGAYGVDFVALKGYPVGVFKGPVNEYDPQGRIVVGNDGYPIASTDKGIYGDAEAKYNVGITNTLKYKDFSLGFTFDVREGGIMYSGIADLQYFVGNAPQTLYNERKPFIIPNSVLGTQNPDGTWTYTENTTVIDMNGYGSYFYPTKNKVADRMRVIDRSYVKLREATLTYTVPKKYLGKMPIGGLDLSVYGKNLLIWTPAENNFIDPEVTSFGNDLAGDFGEFRTNPTLRTFGFSVKATF